MSESFNSVIAEHYTSVYRLALSLSGNHADAEDIAQEVFVAILTALPRFRGEAKLSTWIYRITFRVAGRWLAKRGAVAEVSQALTAVDQSIPIDLIDALRKLTLELRIVVLLVSIEGLSHDEAADALGIPVGTIASRLHYARRKLLEYLSD